MDLISKHFQDGELDLSNTLESDTRACQVCDAILSLYDQQMKYIASQVKSSQLTPETLLNFSLTEEEQTQFFIITDLSMERNVLSNTTAQAISKVLAHPMCRIARLELNDNIISDLGGHLLAQVAILVLYLVSCY